jgi:GT2 family glycosyltransferase
MDVHTEYSADYICRCVEVLRSTGADNVGGPWMARGDGLMGRAIAAAFQSAFAVGGARGHDPNYTGEVDTVYLGCWKRDLFSRIGLFDEELVRNQDDELNLRLVRTGGRVWQSAQIRSWYKPRESLRKLFAQYLQYGYWKVRVIQRHKIPASPRHLVPGAFVSVLLGFPSLFWWEPARWLWLGMVLGYLAILLAASFWTAYRTEWKLLPFLPLVFACFHFGYGLGFLQGVWDFSIVGRRSPRTRRTELTRRSLL